MTPPTTSGSTVANLALAERDEDAKYGISKRLTVARLAEAGKPAPSARKRLLLVLFEEAAKPKRCCCLWRPVRKLEGSSTPKMFV